MVKKKLPKKIKGKNGKYTQYDFNNADDFYDVLLNFNDTMDAHLKPYYPALEGQKRWIFRGHWRGHWGLLPGAFRPPDKNKNEWYERFMLKPQKEIDKFPPDSRPQPISLKNVTFIEDEDEEGKVKFQILKECFLLDWFIDTANSLGIECNYNSYFYEYYNRINPQNGEPNDGDFFEWPHRKLWPLIASAQHHGLPTRFLDFTYNRFYAMFFSASYPFFDEYVKENPKSIKNKRLCVWAIDKINITKMINTKSEADEILSNKPLQENRDIKKFLQEISVTNNQSSNLFAQEGVLLLDTEANHKFNHKKNQWQGLETMGDPDSFIKFTLPQSQYNKLLRRLWENDITPARIMPNLDRVTETLEYKQWLWTEK